MWTRFRPTSGVPPVPDRCRDRRGSRGSTRDSGDRAQGDSIGRPASRVRLAPVLAAVALLAGCNYSFRSGAGLPEHVRTLAVLPFENDTNRFELVQEVHDALLRQLPRALGLTPAGEEAADAVISGTIRSYDLSAPLYNQGGQAGSVQVLQRQVVLVVEVELLDRAENLILWDQSSLRVQGQYLDATETEDDGRLEAIELLVQEIVDGAQSNW